MKTMKLLFCAISIAAASQVQAQNLSTELLGFSPTQQVMGTINGNAAPGQEYTSGVMKYQDFTNSTLFDAFCVQPSVLMSINDLPTYLIQDISLLPNSYQISLLVDLYLTSNKTSVDAAAVQWAIWEITNETTLPSYSLLDGNVQVYSPTGQATVADSYLADMKTLALANTVPTVSLVYLTNNTYQNVVSWNVVPEPGTAGLMVISALCFFRRRR
jgi:hypothetical protein